MANLIFTNKCNLNCPFCFATENNANAQNDNIEEFDLKDVLKLKHILFGKKVRLCGGEPTQNKHIGDTIDFFLHMDHHIHIMTNGLWSKTFSNYIQNLHFKYISKITYLFNILPLQFYSKKQVAILYNTLSIVNPNLSTLGLTIYDENFEYEYIVDLAKRYGFKKIRWSVAAPNNKSGNVDIDSKFKNISGRLKLFLITIEKNEMISSQDCGYIPICFYDYKDLCEIMLNIKKPLTFRCGGSPIDIDRNGNAWRCYGLYSVLKENINNFEGEGQLRSYFDRRIKILDNLYPYSECKTCKYWLKSCDGGCYALRVSRALKEKPNLCLFPIDDDVEIMNCRPQAVNSLIIKEKLDRIYYIDKAFDKPDKNILDYLSEIDGNKSVDQLIQRLASNFNSYHETKDKIIRMTRSLFELDMININYDYQITYQSNKTI